MTTMAKLIALRSGFIDRVFSTWQSSLASNLKQHALLFDQIGIFGLSQIYKVADSSMNYPDFPSGFLKYKLEPIIMELQWLTEKGIIFELTTEGEFREQVVNDYFSKVESRYSVEEVLRL